MNNYLGGANILMPLPPLEWFLERRYDHTAAQLNEAMRQRRKQILIEYGAQLSADGLCQTGLGIYLTSRRLADFREHQAECSQCTSGHKRTIELGLSEYGKKA